MAYRNYSTARSHIVDTTGGGDFTTIQAAINAAVSGETVFLRPGTYTENPVLKANVNLTAFGSDGIVGSPTAAVAANVIILGNTTANYTGDCTLSGIQLQTNGAAALTVSGSGASNLTLINCGIFANDATACSLDNSDCFVTFMSCYFNSSSTNAIFDITSTSVDVEHCIFDLSPTGTASSISGFNIFFNACDMEGLSFTTSTTGTVTANACSWGYGGNTILTTAGTGTSVITNCRLISTSASTISIGAGTTVIMADCLIESSATNVITGAGTLKYAFLSFDGTSSGTNVTTETALPILPEPGGSGFSSVNNQVFTTSGTYTPTSGMAYCNIVCLGGGGAGGGSPATGGGYSWGDGGGAGEYASGIFSAASIGASQTVTIGAGGTGSAGATGGNGGNTSVGALISAFGGTGGGANAETGVGASGFSVLGGTGGSGGDYRTPGAPGFYGIAYPVVSMLNGGIGANSQLGAGGIGGHDALGQPGLGYGSGGGGGSSAAATPDLVGGDGGPGIVIITEYIA